MMTFSVTLRGRRSAADPVDTVQRLAKLFGRSAADAERALALPSLTVKRGVDLRTANTYQAALDDCGACATIEREFIAETSLEGIPDDYRVLPTLLRRVERAHDSADKTHAAMVRLLGKGQSGPGLHAAMEQNLQGMCGGAISLEGLLRYFSADRLNAILGDARNTIAVYRRGGYIQSINYGYSNVGRISAEESDFYTRAAHCYQAFMTILQEHGVLTPGGELPAAVVLRDGKGPRLRAQGQRVQFCHRDSPYVHAGTVDGCYAIGVEVSRAFRDGMQCSSLIPYANLLLDGGEAFRPLPREAVLERRELTGYALPQAPELRLMGTLEVLLDLKQAPASAQHQAFFADFASRVREQSGGRFDSAGLAPGLYRVGGNMDMAAEAVIPLLEPLRLRS